MSSRERVAALDRILPWSHPSLPEELLARVDEALATARASEAAVMTVGAACFDAAEQAHRAAQLAERASAMVAAGVAAGRSESERAGATSPAWDAGPAGAFPFPPAGDSASGDPVAPPASAAPADEALRGFAARADRVAARLRALEGPPLPAATA